MPSESLRGRVVDFCLADLNPESQDMHWRKVKLQIEEVKGSECLTSLYGLDITKDKLAQLVRKWHSLIEGWVDVKTQDNYFIRLFCIAFTQKRKTQLKATCYAQDSHVRQIRKKMMEIMIGEAQRSSLKDLVTKILSGQIAKQISKESSTIFPLQNVLIRKMKMIKKPKFDLTKLMELYVERPEDKKKALPKDQEQPEEAPKNLLEAKK